MNSYSTESVQIYSVSYWHIHRCSVFITRAQLPHTLQTTPPLHHFFIHLTGTVFIYCKIENITCSHEVSCLSSSYWTSLGIIKWGNANFKMMDCFSFYRSHLILEKFISGDLLSYVQARRRQSMRGDWTFVKYVCETELRFSAKLRFSQFCVNDALRRQIQTTGIMEIFWSVYQFICFSPHLDLNVIA